VNFPFVVVPSLEPWQKQRYIRHMNSDESGWHRKWTESIWRRHQHRSNPQLSAWTSETDMRRRLIHFYDEYDVEGNAFVLRNAYLSLNLTLPVADIDEYLELLNQKIRLGGWKANAVGGQCTWARGDLRAHWKTFNLHPQDAARAARYPEHYRHLEIRLSTERAILPSGLESRPFRWFHEVGLRPVLPQGCPKNIEPQELADYLPAQVELGCGPSTEAGVPHLSNLHRIYSVSKPDFSFVFKAKDDSVLNVLDEPEESYRKMTDIYRACLVAEPTFFYHALKKLWNRGLFVGPIITNNFDCLCADLGLPEMSLRRYDTEAYFPFYRDRDGKEIEFHPAAKSLLVIGVHADRRLAQFCARKRGLKVIYIDPERYRAPDGSEIRYPVESPQDEDLFIRMTAGEAMPKIYQAVTAASAYAA
jgi:hypothetical protein